MLTNAKPHVGVLHVTNDKKNKQTNTRWLIDIDAHTGLSVGRYRSV
jgi:hypothetical protein